MRPIHHLMLSSVSFAALALVASPASAQTPDPVNPERDPCQAPADQRDPNVACPPADTPAGEAINQGAEVATAGEGEGIVVVGSRIRRDRFNTADPVTIINRDAAVDAGFNSTAQVLQSVGVTGGTAQTTDTFGGLVVEGGPGTNTLSLRGLGATRTLVLLNGRRLAPAGTRGQVGSADLNVLPTALLDRIEVLNTGASPIYGSDAVAGVVNIVTRSNFNGLTLEATVNPPQVGAGTEKRYALVAGRSGDRFSLVGSIEVYDRDRLALGDQPWARCPISGYLDGEGTEMGAGDYIDPRTGEPKCFNIDEGGVTVNTIGTATTIGTASTITLAPNFWRSRVAGTTNEVPYPAGFTEIRCNRWRPNAAVTTGIMPGFECVGGSLFNPTTNQAIGASLNIRDTFAPGLLETDIISPTRNYTGYLAGTYDTDFFGNGQLYGELLLTRRKSQQNGHKQLIIDYPNDSLLLPQSLLNRGGSAFGGPRVFADFGVYDSSQRLDYIKASAGFRGDLPVLSGWRYDLYGSKSWSDGTYSFEGALNDRLWESVDVIQNSDGTLSCANPLTAGCVPAPVVTPAIIAGDPNAVRNTEWFEWVTEDTVGTTSFRETMANVTLDGPLFRLPGGDMQAAVGFEYRKSRINDQPGENMVLGNIQNFTSAGPTVGSDSVWEAFGEVELPILRDLPFAQALTLNASGRYTHYKSYGGDTTYKVGGLYSPTRWLSLRGSYGTSFRAPALYEQFLSPTSGFLPSSSDPCDQLASESNPTVLQRCLSEGLPPNFTQLNGVQVNQIGGAEAGLEAETSKNLTFGMVFQPTFGESFGNLSIAVDYYRVQVNQGVSQLDTTSILTGCYEGTVPEYCQFVSRSTDPAELNQLIVNTSYVNVATDIARGIDMVLRYDRQLGPGTLDLGVQAVRVLDAINQAEPDSDRLEYLGTIGNPKWAGIGHVGYEFGPWYARWGTEFIKGTDDLPFVEENINPAFTSAGYNFAVDDYWLHTASLRYEAGPYSITAGIRNVFDKDPPRITALNPLVNTISNAPLQSGWDFRGRTFFVNARAKVF